MIRQRSSSVRQTVLLLLCLAGATACSAQTSASDTVYHLHGSVVDGVTGKPLARALVKSADQRLATMTGADGKFSIDVSVPEKVAKTANSNARSGFSGGRGTFYGSAVFLMAQKPGYLEPEDRPTPIILGDTLSSTSVQLKLMPTAVVTGHVSSAAADSAVGVRVTLLHHQVQNGQFLWIPAEGATTNAHGDFRFPDLHPGEYALLTAQWPGEQPQPQQRGVITQQYPPTFYGDVRNLAGSPKLHVRYGEVTRTEIHLHLATYYPITIPVASASPNQFVNARLSGPESLGNSTLLRYNREENVVEGSLPSGDYNVLLTGSSGGPQQSSVLLPLHIDSAPIRTAAIALAPPATIQIRVHQQFTKQDDSANLNTQISGALQASGSRRQVSPQLVQLLLRSEDSNGGYIGASRPSPSGDLVIENLQPGRYFVNAQPFRGYVASITSSGVDLFEHPLIVGSGAPDPIDVTLRDDTATLTGTVNPGDGALPQTSFIALLPTDSSGRFMQSFAGDGKFTASDVPPGSYRVLAFRGQIMQLPYRDAEAMRPYDGKGPTVTITAGQSQQIDVPLLDEVDIQ